MRLSRSTGVVYCEGVQFLIIPSVINHVFSEQVALVSRNESDPDMISRAKCANELIDGVLIPLQIRRIPRVGQANHEER